MKKIHITFETYVDMCERLGKQIRKEKKQYDCILAVARGGMLVGDILSRMLKVPFGVVVTASYSNNKKGRVHLADVSIIDKARLKGEILLVDDLLDTGETADLLQKALKKKYSPKGIDLAVLWHKHTSKVYPDFCVKYFDESENGWIVQPFEEFEDR